MQILAFLEITMSRSHAAARSGPSVHHHYRGQEPLCSPSLLASSHSGASFRPCTVNNCSRPAHGYSYLCSAHHLNNRKNGHPEQRAIYKTDLKPCEALVTDRLDRFPANPVWDVVQRRWAVAVDHATNFMHMANLGKPHNKHERQACMEILKLRRDQKWQDVMTAAAGMFVLQDILPEKFKSDRAFTFQLVRMVRKLGNISAGRQLDSKGRVRKIYPYFPPKAVEILGDWLTQIFGELGLRIARLEVEKDQIAAKEQEDYRLGMWLLR